MAAIGARFQVYGKTAADWASGNPTPLDREICVETDTRKGKIGDGSTPFNSLSYAWVVPGAVTGSGLTMATARLLGRTSASTGAIEEISVGSGLTLASGSLASNVILAQSHVAQSVTGTATETTLATITVPANTMGANGRIEIETLWSYTNSANNKQLRVKFGSLTLQSIGSTTTASLRTSTFVANRNNTSSQVAPPNATSGIGSSINAINTAAIDTTAAVSITITGQLANTGETITLEGYIVRLYR